MDIDEFRADLHTLADTASGYHVLVESEDSVLMDQAIIGTDSVSVMGVACLSIMSQAALLKDRAMPTGQLVVRIAPLEEPPA